MDHLTVTGDKTQNCILHTQPASKRENIDRQPLQGLDPLVDGKIIVSKKKNLVLLSVWLIKPLLIKRLLHTILLEHSARSNVSGKFQNILENTCFPVISWKNR